MRGDDLTFPVRVYLVLCVLAHGVAGMRTSLTATGRSSTISRVVAAQDG